MIKIKNVKKTFYTDLGTTKEVFKNLNLEANPGDFITIIGSNGAGKSTLFNIINGKIIPDEGSIELNGIDITKLEAYKRSKWISQVYQDPTLGTAPSMVVLENLSMAMNKGKKFNLGFGLDIKHIDLFEKELKNLGLGLENQLYTKIGSLSGGQRQCLSLIMSTLRSPEVLLLDEHTAALDPQTSQIILDKTEEVIKRHHIITFMITHNMQDAIKYGNRLLMLHGGEIIFDIKGKEKEELTVEKLLNMFKQKEMKLSDLSDQDLF
ncbi:ABC transporter ATP-binding protein [Caviibacter abscessus]|uniref:ABC transporter ATP-binding protein n=1 Tax=Caviibacter abscessus TaxID=1766719 RepID=UPI0008393041|nr:ATP-binding cassette domain-containing protein [Caviibacter abscessus]